MNPYEEACERFNRASEEVRAAGFLAELLVSEAQEEWEAARANLRQYEQSPGIPLPQYSLYAGGEV